MEEAAAELASQTTAESGIAVGKAIEAATIDPKTAEDERLKAFSKLFFQRIAAALRRERDCR